MPGRGEKRALESPPVSGHRSSQHSGLPGGARHAMRRVAAKHRPFVLFVLLLAHRGRQRRSSTRCAGRPSSARSCSWHWLWVLARCVAAALLPAGRCYAAKRGEQRACDARAPPVRHQIAPHPAVAAARFAHQAPSPTPVAVTACAEPLVFKQTTTECLACSDASEYIYTDAKCCKCVGSAPLPEVGAAVASASGRLGLPAAALAAAAALTSLLT